MTSLLYPSLAFLHLLLFVFWLGADVGVFLLGQHFRRRHAYTLEQRLALLKLLVEVDMVPRTAWALMVPVTLSLITLGGYWAIPAWGLALAWLAGVFWVWLVWDAHAHEPTPRSTSDRKVESVLRYLLAIFYLALGAISLYRGEPLTPRWLATKALLFGLIFAAAIMIDIRFKPVGPMLQALIRQGSSETTELPLLRTMNRTRMWVWTVYLLLLVTAYLGRVKPF
ncbi:MAG: hypothetical protein JSS59_14480 [Proteobacteria bacterium]|nr:hypothetical protein [Pseudomonadota bacterium]